jgi:hypothetical protein
MIFRSKIVAADDYRAKAVECYRAAQKVTDYETRALLALAVQWRELAGLMDRQSDGTLSFRLFSTSIWNVRSTASAGVFMLTRISGSRIGAGASNSLRAGDPGKTSKLSGSASEKLWVKIR